MAFGFDSAQLDGMNAILAAAAQPPPPRSPLRERNVAQPLAKPPPRPAEPVAPPTDISGAAADVIEVDEETADAALLQTGATDDSGFADAMTYARDYQNLAASLRTTGLRLEEVVEAALPHWNPDNKYAFGAALMRAVHDLHYLGVQTVKKCQATEAAARRAERALAKANQPPKEAPKKRERSERIKKAAEQAAKGEVVAEVKAAKKKPASRKRAAAADGDGRKKPRPVGPQKARWPNEFRKLAPENPLRVAFEEAEAKKDAEGAVALKAAVSAIKKWDLYDTAPRSSKITYKQTVSEVEAWVEAGNSKAKAAEWIRRLMSKSEDRLMPSEVRKKTKGDPRRGA